MSLEVAVSLGFVGLALVLLPWLWGSGRLSRAALERHQPRYGRLGIAEVVITVGVFILLTAVAGLAVNAMTKEGAKPSPSQMYLAQGLVSLVMAGFVVCMAALLAKGGVAGWGLTFHRPIPLLRRTFLMLIASWAFLQTTSVVTMLVYTQMTGQEPPKVAHNLLNEIPQQRGFELAVSLVIAVVAAPLWEEIFFRGLLQTVLLRYLPANRWHAIVITSVFFALVHWPVTNWQGLVVLFVFSLCLGYALERTGRVWAPILMHAGFNAVNCAMVLLMAPQSA